MKSLLFFLGVLFSCICAQAQPNITDSIYFNSKKCNPWIGFIQMISTSHGGIFGIRGSQKASPSGGIELDASFYKLNQNFDTLWHVNYGGTEDDKLSKIVELPNGHLLLAGTTSSNDGDVPYGHSYSAQEIWLLEVDTSGIIIKGKTFGGANSSEILDIIVNKWGEIYAVGSTIADDYDFTHSALGQDGWVAKLNSNFDIIWVKFNGGNSDDATAAIKPAKNNFLIAYSTEDSTTATVGADAKGLADIVIEKIDSSGNTIWKKRYGGSLYDYALAIEIDTTNNSYYVVSDAESFDKDITYKTGIVPDLGGNYNSNCWILRTDSMGNKLYSKAYGDTVSLSWGAGMYVHDATFYNGHLYVFCESYGGGGDMIPFNNGYANSWIGKIDSQANLRGKYTINGNGNDIIYNSLIHSGELHINGGSYTSTGGFNDFSCDTSTAVGWVIKIGDAPNVIYENRQQNNFCSISPNPENGILNVVFNQELQGKKVELEICGMDSKMIFKKQILVTHLMKIETKQFSKGSYILKIRYKNKVQNIRFIHN